MSVRSEVLKLGACLSPKVVVVRIIVAHRSPFSSTTHLAQTFGDREPDCHPHTCAALTTRLGARLNVNG